MNSQQAIQKIIHERLTSAQLKNPAYSLRMLARKLGVSATTLSRLLRGDRRISPHLAEKILQRLGLSPFEIRDVLALFPQRRPYGSKHQQTPEQTEALQLTLDQYQVVSDWHYFAVRALLRTPEAQTSPRHSTPEWIAGRLGIKVAQAATAIERLLRLEMIERRPDGGLRATNDVFQSPDGVPMVSLRRNHAQHLELARESLERDSVAIRDFTNLVMTVSRKDHARAKDLIRRFRKEFDQLLTEGATGPRDEVYCFAIQYFPLTQITE